MGIVDSPAAPKQGGPRRAGSERPPLASGLVLGLGLAGLGAGMLCLGAVHGFANGTCSSTGYSSHYGPVPRCAPGTGWWMAMLMVGLLLGGAGAVLVARRPAGAGPGSRLGGLLAAAAGIGGAFAIAAGISGAIGRTTAAASVQVAPGVTVVSSAAEQAREISLCRELVGAQRLIGASERSLLATECRTNWAAAERRLPAIARRAAVAYSAAQCLNATAQTGLPASARSVLAAACAHPAADSQGAGLQSLQEQMCRQIIRAQVPAAARPEALASCRRP